MMLRWAAMERYRKAKLKASSRADSLLAQATACRWSASAIWIPGAVGLAGEADVLADQVVRGLLEFGGGFEAGQRVLVSEVGGVLGWPWQFDAGAWVAAEAEHHVADGLSDLVPCCRPDVVGCVVVARAGVVTHAGAPPVQIPGGDGVAGCSRH